MSRAAVPFPRMARARDRFVTLALIVVAGGCGQAEAPPANSRVELSEPTFVDHEPVSEPEVSAPPFIDPAAATRSACQAACQDVFLPDATRFAPTPRSAHRALLPLAGASGWWVSAAPGREHSAQLCVENEPPELECPWVMPLEATVAWDVREERVRASLVAAEGQLQITLHRADGDDPCTCPPFDLRASPR